LRPLLCTEPRASGKGFFRLDARRALHASVEKVSFPTHSQLGAMISAGN
jgi:hypothetical protein